jgi:hypothetical protein
MKSLLVALIIAVSCGYNSIAAAHHSFASYDFDKQIKFEGVVAEVKFRNPHIELTLVRTLENGKKETIVFSEGAPANMLVRMGLRPEMIKAGTRITAIGSPKKSDPSVYFLRKIILENGKEYGV